MTPKVVFRARSRVELLEARAWYDEQQPGLGDQFAAAVERTIDGRAETPLAFPQVAGKRRRALVRRFPYAVYFRVTDDEIVIVAVLHTRRDSSAWQSRS